MEILCYSHCNFILRVLPKKNFFIKNYSILNQVRNQCLCEDNSPQVTVQIKRDFSGLVCTWADSRCRFLPIIDNQLGFTWSSVRNYDEKLEHIPGKCQEELFNFLHQAVFWFSSQHSIVWAFQVRKRFGLLWRRNIVHIWR